MAWQDGKAERDALQAEKLFSQQLGQVTDASPTFVEGGVEIGEDGTEIETAGHYELFGEKFYSPLPDYEVGAKRYERRAQLLDRGGKIDAADRARKRAQELREQGRKEHAAAVTRRMEPLFFREDGTQRTIDDFRENPQLAEGLAHLANDPMFQSALGKPGAHVEVEGFTDMGNGRLAPRLKVIDAKTGRVRRGPATERRSSDPDDLVSEFTLEDLFYGAQGVLRQVSPEFAELSTAGREHGLKARAMSTVLGGGEGLGGGAPRTEREAPRTQREAPRAEQPGLGGSGARASGQEAASPPSPSVGGSVRALEREKRRLQNMLDSPVPDAMAKEAGLSSAEEVERRIGLVDREIAAQRDRFSDVGEQWAYKEAPAEAYTTEEGAQARHEALQGLYTQAVPRPSKVGGGLAAAAGFGGGTRPQVDVVDDRLIRAAGYKDADELLTELRRAEARLGELRDSPGDARWEMPAPERDAPGAERGSGGNPVDGGRNPAGRPRNTTFKTREFVDGKMVTIDDSFRAYDDPGESAADWVGLMGTKRYESVRNASTLEEAIEAQGRSGYATDPNYAAKLRALSPKNKEQQAFYSARFNELLRAGATPVLAHVGARQSALETGWGKSAPNNNYFGIKGRGQDRSKPRAPEPEPKPESPRLSDGAKSPAPRASRSGIDPLVHLAATGEISLEQAQNQQLTGALGSPTVHNEGDMRVAENRYGDAFNARPRAVSPDEREKREQEARGRQLANARQEQVITADMMDDYVAEHFKGEPQEVMPEIRAKVIRTMDQAGIDIADGPDKVGAMMSTAKRNVEALEKRANGLFRRLNEGKLPTFLPFAKPTRIYSYNIGLAMQSAGITESDLGRAERVLVEPVEALRASNSVRTMDDEMMALETLGYLQNPAHSVNYTPKEATWLTTLALQRKGLDPEGLRSLVEFSSRDGVKLTESNLVSQMRRYRAEVDGKRQQDQG